MSDGKNRDVEEKDPVSLFGTIHLPKRSLGRRQSAARIGKVSFVAIAIICGLVLVTLLYRIAEESVVSGQEVEIEGAREDFPIQNTELVWFVETWNNGWPEEDPRRNRENVTLVASWTETTFKAVNNRGEPLEFENQTVYEPVKETFERDLCDLGSAKITYEPKRPWSIGKLFGSNDEPISFNPVGAGRMTIYYRDTAPTPALGQFWINSSSDEQFVWNGLNWANASSDIYLNEALEFYTTNFEDISDVFGDRKAWIYYTLTPPLFRGEGDLWFEKDENGIYTNLSMYNSSSRTWVNIAENNETTGWNSSIGGIDFEEGVLSKPDDAFESFTPQFCTRAEVAKFIFENGLSGEATIGEVINENGYEVILHNSTEQSTMINITISFSGPSERNLVFTSDNRFAEKQSNGNAGPAISNITVLPGTVSDRERGKVYIESTKPYPILIKQISGPHEDSVETLDLVDPTKNPPTSSAYRTVGDFILSNGPGNSLIDFRYFQDNDLDNDGISDLCDDDIDGDLAKNPVIGGDMDQCPEAPTKYFVNETGHYTDQNGDPSNSPVLNPSWMVDENQDGIHDDVEDFDIDGDDILNLVNRQGLTSEQIWDIHVAGEYDINLSSITNMSERFEQLGIAGTPYTGFGHILESNLSNITPLWEVLINAENNLCDDNHKSNSPEYAEMDCENVRLAIHESSRPSSPQEYCNQLRFIDTKQWEYLCGSPERIESGDMMYEANYQYTPLIVFILLSIVTALMLFPAAIVIYFRKMTLQIDHTSKSKLFDRISPYISFSSEVIRRFLRLLLRVIFVLIGWAIFQAGLSHVLNAELTYILTLGASIVIFVGLEFSSTLIDGPFGVWLRKNRTYWSRIGYVGIGIISIFALRDMFASNLLTPFLFSIGLSFTLLMILALIANISDLLRIRPDFEISRSDAIADGITLLVSILAWIFALRWILIEGWLISGVSLVMISGAFTRLVHGSIQLSRSETFRRDRVHQVIGGRSSWLMMSSVLLVISFVMIPFEINIAFIFSNFPNPDPFAAGLRAAFWGSVYVVGYTMLFSIPVSIGAAIWLEEYAPNNAFRRAIQTLITNLAGVPAVVFGLFGLAVFLTDRGIGLGLGGSILTAGLTMATMAMPTIVIASQEALRAVPPSLRQAAFGLGCTKWQVVKDHVLPHSLPGMMTGTILAMSRIMGEAAPLILVGAVAATFREPDPFFYVDYQLQPNLDALFAWIPGVESQLTNFPIWSDRSPFSATVSEYSGPSTNTRGGYTVLPVQVYRWTDQPAAGFQVAAAGTSLVLLATLVMVNSIAILVRAHFRRYTRT
ncbi:MAG: phosphate ABC transporter permease PstA [Candidatus Thermoplasmatota archaeon]|nr:phosphate ABC transporter permease PstA [Candidatus Thermoplasmatota archaeon]